MPHQCVKCGNMYDDGSANILSGCKCGAKLFFYIRKEKLEKAKAQVAQLTVKEKVKIEKDVRDIMDVADPEKPIVLDFESISILKPGKYELDLVNLFQKKQPLVYRLEDGKYMIDLPETFKKLKSED